MTYRSHVAFCLFLVLWLTPQSQVLAVQSTATVLLVDTAEWQPEGIGLNLSGENDGNDRGKWMFVGAVAGAGLGLLVSQRYRFLGPDQGSHVIAGAVFGAIAGLILSGPSPGESSELRLGTAVRAYIPAQGGIGLALDL